MHDHQEHHHSHDHVHEHGLEHSHKHPAAEQSTAILRYMLDHNRHHAEELRSLADTLRENGKAETADTLSAAVADFDAGNEKLEAALAFLGIEG